jgi:hypothetical protein
MQIAAVSAKFPEMWQFVNQVKAKLLGLRAGVQSSKKPERVAPAFVKELLTKQLELESRLNEYSPRC